MRDSLIAAKWDVNVAANNIISEGPLNSSELDESSSSSSMIVELDDTPPLPSTSAASSSVATNTTPVVARSTAEAATNTSPKEKAEGCPICLDSVQDIRYGCKSKDA